MPKGPPTTDHVPNNTDLATENPYVQEQIAGYLQSLLDLGVAGFRVDAGKHIPANDLAAIFNKTTIGDGLVYFETSGKLGQVEGVSRDDYFGLGDVQEFKVPSLSTSRSLCNQPPFHSMPTPYTKASRRAT